MIKCQDKINNTRYMVEGMSNKKNEGVEYAGQDYGIVGGATLIDLNSHKKKARTLTKKREKNQKQSYQNTSPSENTNLRLHLKGMETPTSTSKILVVIREG